MMGKMREQRSASPQSEQRVTYGEDGIGKSMVREALQRHTRCQAERCACRSPIASDLFPPESCWLFSAERNAERQSNRQ